MVLDVFWVEVIVRCCLNMLSTNFVIGCFLDLAVTYRTGIRSSEILGEYIVVDFLSLIKLLLLLINDIIPVILDLISEENQNSYFFLV